MMFVSQVNIEVFGSLLYIRHHILLFSAYPSWQYFPFSTSISQSEEISTPSAGCGVFMDHCFQRLTCFKMTMSNFPICTHKHFILNCHGQKRQVYFCFFKQRPLAQDLESKEHFGLLSKGGMGGKHPLLNKPLHHPLRSHYKKCSQW